MKPCSNGHDCSQQDDLHHKLNDTAMSHLIEKDLVVDLLLHLSLGPFLPDAEQYKSRYVPTRSDPYKYIAQALTFFLPLLELEAAKALASFEACTFGACT